MEMEIEMQRNDKTEVRAIGRVLARELDHNELDMVSGGDPTAIITTTLTATWTVIKDDTDEDFEDCGGPEGGSGGGSGGDTTLQP